MIDVQLSRFPNEISSVESLIIAKGIIQVSDEQPIGKITICFKEKKV